MSNPVFNNSAVFGDPRARGNRAARQRGGTATYWAAGPVVEASTLDAMYGAPTATTRDTGRLTYDDVIVKTGGLLALLVVVAAATWNFAPDLWPLGAVVGLVLGLVNAFKKNPSPPLIIAYTAAQGVFLGGISLAFQRMTVGSTGTAEPIVFQAVVATMATFGAALFLFRSGKVRVTPKFTRMVLLGLVGYLVFSLLNLGLMVFGVGGGEFGPLRSNGLGMIVGLVAVALAAASLVIDFDSIKRGVEQGVPSQYAWYAAFGLVVTLVWLYLELLRLLAIFRN